MTLADQILAAPFAFIDAAEAAVLAKLATWAEQGTPGAASACADRLRQDARVHEAAGNMIKAAVIFGLAQRVRVMA